MPRKKTTTATTALAILAQAQAAHAAVAELAASLGAPSIMKDDNGRESLYFSPDKTDRIRAALKAVGGV